MPSRAAQRRRGPGKKPGSVSRPVHAMTNERGGIILAPGSAERRHGQQQCRAGYLIYPAHAQSARIAWRELMATTIKVNGLDRTVDVDSDTPLLWVLRDVLGMTGTKFGCGMALCGACTVHVDGNPVRSCAIPIERVGDAAIMTIEAIDETPAGKNVQKAWLDLE